MFFSSQRLLTSQQTKNILALCNRDVIIRNGLSLAQLAQTSSADNKVLAIMADKTQKDSRIMRIATLIAMIYLPANLVMV